MLTIEGLVFIVQCYGLSDDINYQRVVQKFEKKTGSW